MSKVIEIKHTDEEGSPQNDTHEFYFLSECIAEVTAPMCMPSIGEKIIFAGVGYIITDIHHFPEQNATNYTMDRYGVFKESWEKQVLDND